jgi:hypothetical protein
MQDTKKDQEGGVMRGIRRAAQALERTQFLDLHGHHLQDPDAAPPGVAAELQQASAVRFPAISFLFKEPALVAQFGSTLTMTCLG